MYKKIFRIIFFKNTFSWLVLAIENIGKVKTQVIINNNRTLIPNFWWISFTLYLMLKTPKRFWRIIKNLRKFL
jgi:hypothetical protein